MMKKRIGIFTVIITVITFLFFTYNLHKIDSDISDTQTVIAKNSSYILKDSLKNDIFSIQNKYPDVLKNCYALHYDAIVVDAHNDFLTEVVEKGVIWGQYNPFTQSDYPRYIEGGLDVQVFAVYIPRKEFSNAYNFAVFEIEKLKEIERNNTDKIEIAYSFDDIVKIISSGKICGLMGIEGGNAIEEDLDKINEFFERGIRYIGLTWNVSNKIGVSSKDEKEKGIKGKLTKFGFEVVKRMDEVGMLIDVSHLGEGTFWDVIETTKNPIIASHSCCSAINPHHRNLTDEQIKAIASNGGVIMVNFYDEFISSNGKRNRVGNYYQVYHEKIDELRNRSGNDYIKFCIERENFFNENKISGGTRVDDLIEHIDYIKNLVGIDYIGFGSDFDGGIDPPVELYDAGCYPVITKKLAEKGYKEEEIRKILGLNFLRVFKQVCG